MSAETDGYMAEIEYAHSFHAELNPAHLAFALALAGKAAPFRDNPHFAFCELGSGQGLTSNLLAALNPQACFTAIDFLPSHHANATRLAAQAGSANIRHSADSFRQFLDKGGADFDIIALHGVWSWVSAENRAILVEICKTCLKPGGIVALSYNCLPGWAADLPLRRLLLAEVEAAHGTLEQRIDKALAACRRIADQGGFFDHAPSARKLLDSLIDKSASYIAHEFLNRDWAPFYHEDVAAALAPAGLEYGTSATLLDHLPSWFLSPEGEKLMEKASDSVARQTLRDTLCYTRFRRDIFLRDASPLSPDRREHDLRRLGFGLMVPLAEVPESVTTPQGDIALDPALHGAIAEALRETPQSLDHLTRLPALAGRGFETVVEGLAALVGLSCVTPLLHPGDEAGAARFNRAVLKGNRESPAIRQLASPMLNTGVLVDLLDRLFLLALAEDCDPPAFAWEILSGRGQSLRRHGQALVGDAANLAELVRLFDLFAQSRLTGLRRLGIFPLARS